MKNLKTYCSMVAVMAILAFTFSSAIAVSPSSALSDVDDEDAAFLGMLEPAPPGSGWLLRAGQVPLPGDAHLSAAVTPTDPWPVSPADGEIITTSLPEFQFTAADGATKYKIEVFNLLTGVPVYTFKGVAQCAASLCSLKPATALNYYTIKEKSGLYAWRVMAKVNGVWQSSFSDYARFTLLKPDGFNSTFSTDDHKWFNVSGVWSLTTSGTLKTSGETGFYASVISKHAVQNGFVYEVKLKRKLAADAANRIYFLGYPYDEGSLPADKQWLDGYYFEYTNHLGWAFGKSYDGTSEVLASDDSSDAIVPYDWNTLTVMTQGDTVDLWINGQNVAHLVLESVSEAGFVGIAMEKTVAEKSPLSVDYAKLEYTTLAPYPIK